MKRNFFLAVFLIKLVVVLQAFLIFLPMSSEFHLHHVDDCNCVMADVDLLEVCGEDILQPSSKLLGTIGPRLSYDQDDEELGEFIEEDPEPYGKNVLLTGDEQGSISRAIVGLMVQQKIGVVEDRYYKKQDGEKVKTINKVCISEEEKGGNFFVIAFSGLVISFKRMLDGIKVFGFSFQTV